MFPFARFPGVDIMLGPEMKSTGEVMGLDFDFERAFAKSQLGAGMRPAGGGHGVHLGARTPTRPRVVRRSGGWSTGLHDHRHPRHRSALREAGLQAASVNKVLEGRPHASMRSAPARCSW